MPPEDSSIASEHQTPYDVFLCYNSEDVDVIWEFYDRLKARGLRPWFDKQDSVPGRVWYEDWQAVIEQVGAVAVFVGDGGFGPWQKQEVGAFLFEFVKRGLPVIPVLLENAPSKPALPLFLGNFTWVDFKQSRPAPFDRLVLGITSKRQTFKKTANIRTSHAEHLSTNNEVESLLNSPRSVATPKLPGTSQFSFTVVTVDVYGQKQDRHQSQNQCFTEEVGEGIKLDLMMIPGGEFQMGSVEQKPPSRESPVHCVTIQPILIGKYPITKAQWKEVAKMEQVSRPLKLIPSRPRGAQHPVVQVSWYEAVEFCERLSNKTGCTYRLPTEAEWEYSCKAGTTTPFHFGETVTSDLANYDASYQYRSEPKGHSHGRTVPVNSFPFPNFFGLSDMHGNVWEWCLDHWHDNYKNAPSNGSAWIEADDVANRVIRGGSWRNEPNCCRSTYRMSNNADDKSSSNLGFRIARVL
jgi:formylglycine-generating enzyme required for sulfatase activity